MDLVECVSDRCGSALMPRPHWLRAATVLDEAPPRLASHPTRRRLSRLITCRVGAAPPESSRLIPNRALPDGGAIIVYDALIDDTRRGPSHSLLASLNMLI
jgi:hypothetical protein